MAVHAAAYLRMHKMPHIWCPGCGNGIVLGALVRAIAKLGYSRDEVVVVTGIGCSARTNAVLDFNTFQTTHGRALSFATGLKLVRPELKIIVVTGDGDGAAIGGNHLIHTARRNIDLTAVLINNSIYGMTGGQYSPLTPPGSYTTTAPYGTLEPVFDACKLAQGAGATYVARSTAYHVVLLEQLIKKAISHKGFAFVEAVSQCPVGFGRLNSLKTASDMLHWQKERAISAKAALSLSAAELEGKIVIGELVNESRPELTEVYRGLLEKFSSKTGEV